jgi:hypothetical protein
VRLPFAIGSAVSRRRTPVKPVPATTSGEEAVARGRDLGAVAAGDLAAHIRGNDRSTPVPRVGMVGFPKQLNSKERGP